MIQLSDRMPANSSDEVPGSVLGPSREVGLDGHQVIGNSIGNGSLHGVRAKLEEWEIMVGQPRHQPAVIGRTQAFVVAHGPTVLPAIADGRIMGYSDLLHRGSAPWRGGTVTMHSQC